jgi:tetratricopeptide (TPR) repeat protein
MSRAAFISAVFLITCLTFNTVSAQTDAPDGSREREAGALYAEAESLYAKGEFERAAVFYKEATLRAPESAEAYTGVCVSRAKLRDYEAAEAACMRAAELQPGSPRLRANLGRVLRLLGREGDAIEELRRALECYRRALELKPDYPEVFYQTAYAELMLKHYARASHAVRR